MKENSNFKIVMVMKSMSKVWLNHLLLSITFNDKYWRSQLDFLHLSAQHINKDCHEKKSNLNNALLLLLGLSPKKWWFWYTGALNWSTLPWLYPSQAKNCINLAPLDALTRIIMMEKSWDIKSSAVIFHLHIWQWNRINCKSKTSLKLPNIAYKSHNEADSNR